MNRKLNERIDDRVVLEFKVSKDAIYTLLPSLDKKRRKQQLFQPKCHLEVCRTMCPYSKLPFRADIIRLDNGSDAVCLSKECKRGEHVSCIVMYLRGKCEKSEEEIESDPFGFMRRHSSRIMNDDCPMKTEHLVGKWSNRRKTK